MSRKLALLVTTALTMFVLITVAALVAFLGTSRVGAQSAPAATEVARRSLDVEIVQQREQTYRQRLEEANARLQKLQDQNAILIQRESAYQKEIQKANALLAQIFRPRR